jgi:hypothetical protein
MKRIAGVRFGFRVWWDGVVLECRECGSVVQLEDGDEKRADVIVTGEAVAWRCSRCQEWVSRERRVEERG